MTEEFTIQQWDKYEGEDWWKWAVWIEAPNKALDLVDFVEWILHPTFPNPVRRISDRTTKFRLETAGWGVFQITAHVQMKDGKQVKLDHFLRFHYPES
jgi:transcription initiation factor IIF auxiliary subunit